MDLDTIFRTLKIMLEKHSSDLDAYDEFINSKAKVKKKSFHLYGKDTVELFGKKQKAFLAGIIKQKSYVGFYFSPIYSDRDHFQLSDELSKALHGKSCFYIKDLSYADQIEALFIRGKKLYREKGWI